MTPKVPIEKLGLAENCYVRDNEAWSASNLIQWCKEQDYPIFKLPLVGINLNTSVWKIDNIYDFIYHMNRCKDCNKTYPIILDDAGQVCDGWHRICKAIIDGDAEIDAIRIEKMPDADGIREN